MIDFTPTINTKANRVHSFDITRGVCILLMVMGHAGFGMDFHKIIHAFHMPIFFFISGFFYHPDKISTFGRYFTHLLRTLILPYIVFCLFYEFLHILYTNDISLHDFLIEVISSNHNRLEVAGSLWFLLCLFSAKLLYFIIDRTTKRIGINQNGVTLIIFIISLTANCLRKIDIILPFCMDSALSCLLLIHAGYMLRKNKDTKHGRLLLFMPWMLLLSFVVLFVLAEHFNTAINVRRNRFGIIPLYWISCFCGMFIILNVSALIDKSTSVIGSILKSVLGYWGRESLVFLIFNELVLFVVGFLLRIMGLHNSLIANNYYIHLVMVAIAMTLLSFSAYFANKKPLKFLFGKC